jgi:predicted PurR-regulated permease PerM
MDQIVIKRLFAVFLPVIILWLATQALGSAMVILVLAFICGYLLLPLFRKLEQWKLPRALSAIILFFLLVAMGAALILAIIPGLIRETQQLLINLPEFLSKALDRASQWLASLGIAAPESTQEWLDYLKVHASEILQAAARPFVQSVTTVASGTLSILTMAMNLILFPVFFFFLILDFEKNVQTLKQVIPSSQTNRFNAYFQSIEGILSGFFRGQILVCFVLSLIYGLGFWAVGVPYGGLIGFLGGVLSFIPYLGSGFSLVTSIIVALALGEPFSVLIGAFVVFGAAQLLESFVLTPKLVGDKVGLSPLATILALIAGGNIAGFAGLLIAVPAAGILKVIAKDLLKEIHEGLK